MIGSLRGTVLERVGDNQLLIEVQGIGYLVLVTPRTFAELEPTCEAFLYVHHHIREELQTLFGFLSRAERAAFQLLLSAHGVGPSLALAVLGTHQPSSLMQIIASQDISALTLVPGVGKKTAERLLVDLKGRAELLEADGSSFRSDGSSSLADVRQALSNLGYSEIEIRESLHGLDPRSSSSDLLRDALRVLGVRRA